MNLRRPLSALTLGTSLLCSAGDLGLGVSMKTGEDTLFLPYRISERLMVEGKAWHGHTASSSQTPGIGTDSQTWDSLGLGMGLLWRRPLGESLSMYGGPRLGYQSVRNHFNNPGGPGWFTETRLHGWTLTPSVGVEYFPVKHLSLGGEVGYEMTRMTGISDQNGMPSTTLKSTSTSTVTSLILRYYF